jgi:hypothetical protein
VESAGIIGASNAAAAVKQRGQDITKESITLHTASPFLITTLSEYHIIANTKLDHQN